MGELRKDYFLDRFVIVSPERAKRPHDFTQHPMEPIKATPFTPGNESMMPPIIEEHPKGANWRFRVIPNKFAITKPEGEPELRTDKLYTFANNFGYHEIVIEGREDGASFANLGAQGIKEAINVAINRVKIISAKQNIKHVAYFKNERPEAGASINHPHSQIVSFGVVPSETQLVSGLHSNLRKQFSFSPLYKILDLERGTPRMVYDGKHFAALCPYASQYAMEVLIIPLRDNHSYVNITDEELSELGALLHKLLSKLASIGAPFNILWQHTKEPSGMHWHIRICPRMNVWAGLELESGIIVNPTPPEDAAVFYRS